MARKYRDSFSTIRDKQRTILADETHPLRPVFDNRHIGRIKRQIARLHNIYSHSFHRPFGHSINKQADKHNT